MPSDVPDEPRALGEGPTPRPCRLLRRQTLGAAVGGVLLLSALVLALLHAFPSLQLGHLLLTFAAAFIPYGLLASLLSAVLLAGSRVRGRPVLVAAALATTLLFAAWNRPYLPMRTDSDGDLTSASLRIATTNVRCHALDVEELNGLLAEIHADVSVVQGVYESQDPVLRAGTESSHPHTAFFPMSKLPECGTSVISRHPLDELPASTAEQALLRLQIGSTDLALLPVDLRSPLEGLAPWQDSFDTLTQSVRRAGGRPVIAVGDFNAVREHAPMRDLQDATGLADAAILSRAGWQPTYGLTAWPPGVIAIDHVLVRGVRPTGPTRTYAVDGQQHRLLVADLATPPED